MNNLFRDHPRLWISVITGAAIYFCLPAGWPGISRVLMSWDFAYFSFTIAAACQTSDVSTTTLAVRNGGRLTIAVRVQSAIMVCPR